MEPLLLFDFSRISSYPKLSLKEPTVRRLKEMYQAKLHEQPGAIPFADIFSSSKENWSSIDDRQGIGQTCKSRTSYITYMRSTETVVNTAVVIACAEGILLHEALICYRGLILTKAGLSMY